MSDRRSPSCCYRAGYAVALHDEPAPATPRRGMAFADAVFDGWATLDGLTAVRVKTPAELRHALNAGDVVPVVPASFAEVIEATTWSALIDARMRKRAVPERQRGIAPLTIGLGPNFVAGETVDLAIETMWGDRLGEIIDAGATLPLGGEPRPIGGVGRARFVYAPDSGRFMNERAHRRSGRGKRHHRDHQRRLRCARRSAACSAGLTRSGVEVADAHEGHRGRSTRRSGRGIWLGRTAATHRRGCAEGNGPHTRGRAGMTGEIIGAVPVIGAQPRSSPAAFGGGAIIGRLGGLIGLGGAEFRLPLLIGAFRFAALQAVILNKAMSLVVVASALPFRAAAVPLASVAAHWPIIVNLLAGSLLGAWFGAGWATRLASHTLYRVIAVLLLGTAVVLVLGSYSQWCASCSARGGGSEHLRQAQS